jgi:hypothetical protein
MAESQVPYPYLQADLQAIRSSVSEPRFFTYLVKGGNHEEYAMALYLYNARVAKAFLFPLNVAEVTLRNAIDSILVTKFGTNWHLDPTFRNTVLTECQARSSCSDANVRFLVKSLPTGIRRALAYHR